MKNKFCLCWRGEMRMDKLRIASLYGILFLALSLPRFADAGEKGVIEVVGEAGSSQLSEEIIVCRLQKSKEGRPLRGVMEDCAKGPIMNQGLIRDPGLYSLELDSTVAFVDLRPG